MTARVSDESSNRAELLVRGGEPAFWRVFHLVSVRIPSGLLDRFRSPKPLSGIEPLTAPLRMVCSAN